MRLGEMGEVGKGVEWCGRGEWLAFAVLSEGNGGVNATIDHETRETIERNDSRLLEGTSGCWLLEPECSTCELEMSDYGCGNVLEFRSCPKAENALIDFAMKLASRSYGL